MPDPIKLITRRVEEMTYKAVDKKAQFVWGQVLSRNPDGTLNIDDGKGGCILIVPPMNARTGDMAHVDLGAMIGGPNMPGVASYSASVPQTNHGLPTVIVTDTGATYTMAGAFSGTSGTPVAAVDDSYGYYISNGSFPSSDNLLWAGAKGSVVGGIPTWHDVQIGTRSPDYTGHEGEAYYANNTVLCQGLGGSADILCGAEHLTDPSQFSISPNPLWRVNIRDRATFTLIASDSATYIHDWIITHGNTFNTYAYGSANPSPPHDEDYGVHVSPDPQDGTFWINLRGGPGWGLSIPPFEVPMFNVSQTDGSLIKTVRLAVPTAGDGVQRAHVVVQS